KNTISDPANGIRDHAILRLLFGLPVRSIEMIRLMTSDVCNQAGTINPNEKLTIRKEISFSGIERPMPLLNSQLIKALQLLIDWRIENGWGVTPTGYIDLDTPLFLVNKTKGFATNNIIKDGKQKVSAQSINRVIKKRFELNGIEGNIESGLRTWTLNRHHEGRDARAIWMLRGDLRFDTVQNIIRNDHIRLGALVENVY
ncbi:hypothetical protein MNBD_GAMMA08-1112, partial [hydrothermal vent metagenome]